MFKSITFYLQSPLSLPLACATCKAFCCIALFKVCGVKVCSTAISSYIYCYRVVRLTFIIIGCYTDGAGFI